MLVKILNRSTIGIMMNKPTVLRLCSPLQKFMEDYTGLDFLLSLYTVLQYLLTGLYVDVSIKLKKIWKELAKLVYKLFSLSPDEKC